MKWRLVILISYQPFEVKLNKSEKILIILSRNDEIKEERNCIYIS